MREEQFIHLWTIYFVMVTPDPDNTDLCYCLLCYSHKT